MQIQLNGALLSVFFILGPFLTGINAARLLNVNYPYSNYFKADTSHTTDADIPHPGISNVDILDLQTTTDADIPHPGIPNVDILDLHTTDADIPHPDISNVDISELNVYNANISRSNLPNVNISNLNIYNTAISHPNISNSKSKFKFLANITFEEEGLSSLFSSFTNLLKGASSLFGTNKVSDDKIIEEKEINAQLPHLESPSWNLAPTDKTFSGRLIENIVLNKPTIAASSYRIEKPTNGNDGDLNSYSFSVFMKHPWWIVPLEDTYKVVKITYYSQPLYDGYGLGVQFFVVDNIVFDSNGSPDITNLTLFSERTTIPVEEPGKSVHEVPEGHIGRQLLVIKGGEKETNLKIDEIEVAGYLYS